MGIEKLVTQITDQYNIDSSLLFFLIIMSIIPIYLGIFFILRGSTREMTWRDILFLRIRKLRWNKQTKTGFILYFIGFIVPYVYVLLVGRNIPVWFYLLILMMLCLTLSFFFMKIKRSVFNTRKSDISVVIETVITDEDLITVIWRLYDKSFLYLNENSPCKQSFEKDEFRIVMKNRTVEKYLAYDSKGKLIGIAFITNNLNNTPWISKYYFKKKFPEFYKLGLIYYFMGIAIDNNHIKKGYSLVIIEKIIDHLPTLIMGFDHSKNVNPYLHYFTKLITQSSKIKRKLIEEQHYHIVYYNK